MTLARQPRPARRGRRAVRLVARVAAFPLADNEFTEFLEISVTDSGIGISPEGLEHAVQAVQPDRQRLARKFEGTGLGLAMVKLLAELHGGTVAVESAVGEGSRFTVWLPLRPAEGTARTPAKRRSSVDACRLCRERATALVVEDDFKSADLIRVQLEAEGFTVLHAATAEAALVLAAQQPLSLITLDIMLPNMDGWEFLGRIKQAAGAAAHSGGDHFDRRGSRTRASRSAPRRHAEADLAAGAVRLARRTRSVSTAEGETLKVLVVDDDPKAVELIAVRVLGLASTVLRAYGGTRGDRRWRGASCRT